MRKDQPHKLETRARLSVLGKADRARRADIARIAPWELTEAIRRGTVPEHRRAYLSAAAELGLALVNDLGGLDQLSAARLALVKGVERCELPIAMLVVRLAQSDTIDGDLVSKLTSLLNAQRANLLALGLDRVEHDAMTLTQYVAAQDRASRANGSTADSQPADAEINAQERSE